MPLQYGTAGEDTDIKSAKKAFQINPIAVLSGLIVPWTLFVAIFADVSFAVHYWHWDLCWSLVALGGALTGGVALLILYLKAYTARDTSWFTFVLFTMIGALVFGSYFGNLNYRWYMESFYEASALNAYSEVDPSVLPGQGMMDAGQIQFAHGVTLDLTLTMGFQNRDIFCVAPVGEPQQNQSGVAKYDLWAVGKNCCSGPSTKFQCGDYGQPGASSGVRVLGGVDLKFYRLAVQQAEATFNIEARHPVFIKIVTDTRAGLQDFARPGRLYFVSGILLYLLAQLGCVFAFITHTLDRRKLEEQLNAEPQRLIL